MSATIDKLKTVLANATPKKTRPIYNPNDSVDQADYSRPIAYTIFDYDETTLTERRELTEEACKPYHDNGHVTWINIDGLRPDEVQRLCHHYNVHPLVVEDILSKGQRAKMDEIGEVMFCLLPMLYYNEKTSCVEREQVSIVLGKDFVLSFQEEASRDVFDRVRNHLRNNQSRLRSAGSEYLCYALLDVIVDSYFLIVEALSQRIETLEDDLSDKNSTAEMTDIVTLRREVQDLHRAIFPVQDVINGFVRSENPLVSQQAHKYYKDVYDHIRQANDYADGHRDMLSSLQDLYMNQVNLKLNQIMKIFTMVALLLAPATVIGGIFGMNFNVIPLQHHQYGFWVSVAGMVVIPIFMLIWFKKKRWY